jgi:hypothetical protein
MAHVINNQSVTIITNNTIATCSLEDHACAEEVLIALRRGDETTAIALINKDRDIKDWVNDEQTLRVEGRTIMHRDDEFDKWRPLHNALVDRIISMREQGFDPGPMVTFLANINLNPSEEAKKDLYGFLETNSLPVTIDGHFLAYKKVRSDFKDGWSGTFDNSPGKTIKMDRAKVVADRNKTCAAGLHVCSGGYLGNSIGGNTIMLIKVHPMNVVSVPTDYKNSKMRTCEYTVVKQLNKEDVEKVAVYVS